jgi:uncharacterized protein (UPF0335 family)
MNNADCKAGQYVRMKSTRGTRRWRIEEVARSGSLSNGAGLSIEGSEDDPALKLMLMRKGQPSGQLRLFRLSQLKDAEIGEQQMAGETLFEVAGDSYLGQPPHIPLPPDIDLSKLKATFGESLKFVTLPIGKVGITSRNGNTYGRKAIEKLVEQVNRKRPEGRWGHLSQEQIGTAYEPPAVRWLAATLDATGTAWGKLVALTAEAARHFETAEATGARVGTSIFGMEPKEENGEIVEYRLVTIDLANAERVGVPMTAAHPHITAEMEGATSTSPTPDSTSQKGNPMPSEVRIEELISEKTTLQGEVATLKEQIKTLKGSSEDVRAVREMLDLEDDADVVKSLRSLLELHGELKTENTALLDAAMDAAIAKMVAVETARPIVRELVEAKKPLTRKQLDRALDEVLNRESVKALIQKQVAEQAGPAQKPAATQPRDADPNAWKKFLDMPAVPAAAGGN